MSPAGNDARFAWRVAGEDDDAWEEIEALDAYAAAKAVAELHDREDRAIIRTGRSPIFEIRLVEDRRTALARRFCPIGEASTFWSVTGEAVPTYYPHQVAAPGAGASACT